MQVDGCRVVGLEDLEEVVVSFGHWHLNVEIGGGFKAFLVFSAQSLFPFGISGEHESDADFLVLVLVVDRLLTHHPPSSRVVWVHALREKYFDLILGHVSCDGTVLDFIDSVIGPVALSWLV